jgi:hypothetical protein
MGRVLAAAAGALIAAGAGMAAAGNFASSAHSDYFAAGQHQFYVWCAGSSDFMATESGSNAEDAQLRLYDAFKAKGRATCWPLWQGRLRT